jgi:hypothetical protein
MAVGKTARSNGFKAAIGPAKTTENDTFKTYAGLVDRFGASVALSGDETSVTLRTRLSGNNEGLPTDITAPEDRGAGRRLRAVDMSWGDVEYPNPDDIVPLRGKKLPAGMKFYYVAECDDFDFSNSNLDLKAPCKKSGKFTMRFWRGMRAADADDLRKNLNAYNRLLKAGNNPDVNGSGFRAGVTPIADRYLKLIRHVAGESWPEDLLVLAGEYREEGCGGLPGLYGWLFDFKPRPVELHAVLIKNESTRPIALDGLFGRKEPSAALRRLESNDAVTASREPLPWKSQTLAPGQSVLIPTQIVLASPKQMTDTEQKEAEQILARVGTNGFQGSPASFKIINMPDYAYGPGIALGAISLGGKQIELRRQAVNFIDMTASLEAGSCPYLLAWDEREREWVNHGKVLHKAPSREHEYTEVRALPGFASRFRLEEREAELAFIDHVEFSLVLTSGDIVKLATGNEALAARDGNYLQLYWGDAVELEFILPAGIKADDVAETRLAVTGYYRRYSALMAEQGLDRRASRRAMRGGTLYSMSVAATRLGSAGPACSR